MTVIRHVSDLWRSAPLALFGPAPGGWVSDPLDLEPFFETPGGRVGRALDSVVETYDSELRARGWAAIGYDECGIFPKSDASGRAGLVSSASGASVWFVPPAFLDLSSWGRVVEWRGRRLLVPSPGEFELLLRGGSVPRFSGGEDFDLVGVPSLGSRSPREFSVVGGTLLTRTLGLVAERGKDFGARTRASVEALHYEDFDICSGLVKGPDGYVLDGMAGLGKSFGREVWQQILPVLSGAWERRAGLVRSSGFPALDGGFSGVGTPGGFRVGALQFGFSAGSVLPGQIEDDLRLSLNSVASLFAAPVQGSEGTLSWGRELVSWANEDFAFFLRCLDIEVLGPLGLSGGDRMSAVGRAIGLADEGRPVAPREFCDSFPGGSEGFRAWLEDVFRASARLVEANVYYSQEGLPRRVVFEVPDSASLQEDYVRRSYFTAASEPVIPVGTQVSKKGYSFEFPVFSVAWRTMSGLQVRWPAEFRTGERRRMAPEFWGDLVDSVKDLPVKDGALGALAAARLHPGVKGSEGVLQVAGFVEDHAIRFSKLCSAGYFSSPSKFRMEGLFEGRVFPQEDLSRLAPLLGESPVRFLAGLRGWLKKLTKTSPVSFSVWSPLRDAPVVPMSMQEAVHEVYTWYAQHEEFARLCTHALTSEELGLVRETRALALQACKAFSSGDVGRTLVGLEALRIPLSKLMESAPWLLCSDGAVFGTLHPGNLARLCGRWPLAPDDAEVVALAGKVREAVALLAGLPEEPVVSAEGKVLKRAGKTEQELCQEYGCALGVDADVRRVAGEFANVPVYRGCAAELLQNQDTGKLYPRVYGLAGVYAGFLTERMRALLKKKNGPKFYVWTPKFKFGGLVPASGMGAVVRDFKFDHLPFVCVEGLLADRLMVPPSGQVDLFNGVDLSGMVLAPGILAPGIPDPGTGGPGVKVEGTEVSEPVDEEHPMMEGVKP